MKFRLAIALIPVLFYACNNAGKPADENDAEAAVNAKIPTPLHYTVLNVFPHDSTAFTQGLIVHEGKLYESTGAPDHYRSSLRITEPETGKIVRKIDQGKDFFAEGITILNGKLYQLTWQDRKIFVYDAATLNKIGEYPWHGEGWGITNNGSKLIISDGLTNNLYITDPETLRVEDILGINDENGPVYKMNELEYIDGYVFANKWETNFILKIDLNEKRVVGRADLTGLLERNTKEDVTQQKYQTGAVLNGIAYDSASSRLFVTGKLWPYIFEIKWQ